MLVQSTSCYVNVFNCFALQSNDWHMAHMGWWRIRSINFVDCAKKSKKCKANLNMDTVQFGCAFLSITLILSRKFGKFHLETVLNWDYFEHWIRKILNRNEFELGKFWIEHFLSIKDLILTKYKFLPIGLPIHSNVCFPIFLRKVNFLSWTLWLFLWFNLEKPNKSVLKSNRYHF